MRKNKARGVGRLFTDEPTVRKIEAMKAAERVGLSTVEWHECAKEKPDTDRTVLFFSPDWLSNVQRPTSNEDKKNTETRRRGE
jgi:hypothetical protein